MAQLNVTLELLLTIEKKYGTIKNGTIEKNYRTLIIHR